MEDNPLPEVQTISITERGAVSDIEAVVTFSRPVSPRGTERKHKIDHGTKDKIDHGTKHKIDQGTKHKIDYGTPGAIWLPPLTEHELHSREVYIRSKTPSPPCDKYWRDKRQEEINPAVVRKREEDANRHQKEAHNRHIHEGMVMQRAREFERMSRSECERYSKQKIDYKGRMKQREIDSRPKYRNRAEQEKALGLSPSSSSRPGSA